MSKCIGCGSLLQNENKNKEGYVKDLTKDLCERCFKIKHYNDYNFIDKDNNYYLDIIKQIEKTKDLVLLVTDFLNIDALDELMIKNNVILVLSKRDLIPRHIDENKLLNNIKTNLNIVSRVVIGSKNNYNLDLLFDKINNYKTSKNVYVIGYTNAGKSTLINKIIKNYSNNNNQITTSLLPSTTLDLIYNEINENLTIIDTPGLLDEGSIILKIKDKSLKKILPNKEIKPRVIQVKTKQTIIVENLFRLDIDSNSDLIFYMSNDLKIERFYKKIKTKEDVKKTIEIKANYDLIIKGLGFIKFTKDCTIDLFINNNVKYKIRQSLI